jgi:hypothetical protein
LFVSFFTSSLTFSRSLGSVGFPLEDGMTDELCRLNGLTQALYL